MSSISPSGNRTPRASGGTFAALALGLPVAAAIVACIHFGPLKDMPGARYVEHPVQWAVVAFFCCGVGGLAVRLMHLLGEQSACGRELLPRWDGKPVAIDKAGDLLSSVLRQPASVQATMIGRRVRAVIDFVTKRRSAAQLDDQLRTLSDAEALAHENACALVRFITWAIPILGFLGTVLGITQAISGVTPEALEEGMSSMTNGLAEAFDSTALALGLTMVLMFMAYLVDKPEQALLATVDSLVEDQLAHRFQREAIDSAPFIGAITSANDSTRAAVEAMAVRQAELWAEALNAPDRRIGAMMDAISQQLAGALGQALENTCHGFAARLATFEQASQAQVATVMASFVELAKSVQSTAENQQKSLIAVAEGIATQARVLSQLQEDSANVVHLQAVLHQNLSALASTGAFEEAVHSLTAAVHLLTVRASGVAGQIGPRPYQPGAAA